METTDRYVFAKLDGTGWYASNVTDIPAPSPEDWQTIEDAVDAPSLHTLRKAVDAAVRNMREAER